MKRRVSFFRLLTGPALAVGLVAILLLWNEPFLIFRMERIRAMGESRTSGVVLYKSPLDDGCLIDYKYADGRAHALYGQASFDAETCRLLRPGMVLDVIIADAQPALSRVPGQREDLLTSILGAASRDE